VIFAVSGEESLQCAFSTAQYFATLFSQRFGRAAFHRSMSDTGVTHNVGFTAALTSRTNGVSWPVEVPGATF